MSGYEDALKNSASALFGEKYCDRVHVVSIEIITGSSVEEPMSTDREKLDCSNSGVRRESLRG